MEYYSGTLFLTTNRPATIDEAFNSRIHIRLKYQPLSFASRRQVWTNYLKWSDVGAAIDDEDLDALAEKDLNGRQIKNILRTAVLMAKGEDEVLNRWHIDTLLEMDPQ